MVLFVDDPAVMPPPPPPVVEAPLGPPLRRSERIKSQLRLQ